MEKRQNGSFKGKKDKKGCIGSSADVYKIARLRQAAIAINLLHAKHLSICIAFYELHFIHCNPF